MSKIRGLSKFIRFAREIFAFGKWEFDSSGV